MKHLVKLLLSFGYLVLRYSAIIIASVAISYLFVSVLFSYIDTTEDYIGIFLLSSFLFLLLYNIFDEAVEFLEDFFNY